MEVNDQLLTLAALSAGERDPGSLWIRGWLGPRTDLNAVVNRKKKSLFLPEIESRSSRW